MTAGTIETARDGGGHGESLRGSPMNASAQGVLGEIMSPKRSNTPCAEQKTRLPISRSVINSSERPMAVVGQRPSGKSRIKVSKLLASFWWLRGARPGQPGAAEFFNRTEVMCGPCRPDGPERRRHAKRATRAAGMATL